MKKYLKFTILSALAVAVIALSGCSKNEEGMPEVQKKDFSVVLSGVSTKTTNSGMSTLWAVNDAINLFHAPEGTTSYVSDDKFVAQEAGTQSTFNGDLKEELTASAYDWYAYYPYNKNLKKPDNKVDGDFYSTVGCSASSSQKQTGNNNLNHIAGSNYPMAGRVLNVDKNTSPVVQMKHLSSLLAVKVTNGLSTPITVSNVTFSTDGDPIVGSFFVDFSGDVPKLEPEAGYVSTSANLTVENGEEISSGGSATFYLAIRSYEHPEGSDLTLSVTANNGVQSKVITAPSNIMFSAGKIKTLNFTYDKTGVTYDFTTVAELNALATSSAASHFGKLTNAVVSFVPSTSNAIIKDATGSVLLYKSGHGLKQGQTCSGDITVTLQSYNSCSEITNYSGNTFTGDETTVEPETLTLAQLVGNLTTYQNAYVKVSGLEITSISGQNLTVQNGTNTYQIYYTGTGTHFEEGDIITAIGTVCHKDPDDQIRVWKAADLIVDTHTPKNRVITFTQPTETGCSIKVKNGSTEISSGASVLEGTVLTLEATAGSGFNFTAWNVTGATVSGNTNPASFTVGTSNVSITAAFVSTALTYYTLDGEAIKAAHSTAWNYTSGTHAITATDGSVWTSVNTFGDKDQVTVQMNTGKGCYLLTPDVGTKKIKKLTIDLNSNKYGTGAAGTRSLIISKADGSGSVTVSAAALIAGYTPTVNESQLKIEPSSDGAVYLKSVRIDFE